MPSYQDSSIPFVPAREHLPHEPNYAPITARYIADAPTPPPRFVPTPPEGAPKPAFCYNLAGREHYDAHSKKPFTGQQRCQGEIYSVNIKTHS